MPFARCLLPFCYVVALPFTLHCHILYIVAVTLPLRCTFCYIYVTLLHCLYTYILRYIVAFTLRYILPLLLYFCLLFTILPVPRYVLTRRCVLVLALCYLYHSIFCVESFIFYLTPFAGSFTFFCTLLYIFHLRVHTHLLPHLPRFPAEPYLPVLPTTTLLPGTHMPRGCRLYGSARAAALVAGCTLRSRAWFVPTVVGLPRLLRSGWLIPVHCCGCRSTLQHAG